MKRISTVKVLPEYRLELRFDHGVCGIVDLSEAVGKGVFSLRRDHRWSEEITAGRLTLVDQVKRNLGFKATWREVAAVGRKYTLQEQSGAYAGDFGSESDA